MLRDVIEARPVGAYRLYLRFDDGVEGEVDVSSLVSFHGEFEPLRDLAEFLKVRVDPDLGTVVWPNGADIDPNVLYAVATGHAKTPEALASLPEWIASLYRGHKPHHVADELIAERRREARDE